jgi:hypothetical protein
MTKHRAGDWVRVRSKDEILRTLDKRGRLEGLPFMPQMFQYCGQEFQVYKRAHKTCDTVSGKCDGRRLADGVHLNLRCDGQAFDGCQAACLLFWKEAWLQPLDKAAAPLAAPADRPLPQAHGCTEEDVVRAARDATGKRYVCQATELLNYTSPLPWWDARQYVEDYRSGNATLEKILRGLVYSTFYYGSLAHRNRLGTPARWLFDKVRRLWRGRPMPRAGGKIALGAATPVANLSLKPGELVRVKPFEEILTTIDQHNRNRGLVFDAEMVPFCGGIYRVRARVEHFVDERTGTMKSMKTPAVILENVFCEGCYSANRMFCPRCLYAWWREIWLERVPEKQIL